MSRLAYFARETLISLRRNLLMTIAGIITVLISLVLFGGILLLSSAVDHGTEKWKHGVELEIFMKVNASKSSSVMSSASFFSVVSACLSGSSVAFFSRFSAVFARALCEERNALSRVYGNRRR